MSSHLVLDRAGTVLGAYPDLSAARDAAHTLHADTYAWVTARDGTLLAYRWGVRPQSAPAPVWPRLAAVPSAPGCPVLAALDTPRTLDDLAARLALPRPDVVARLLALLDTERVTFRYDHGERWWMRAGDPSAHAGKVGA